MAIFHVQVANIYIRIEFLRTNLITVVCGASPNRKSEEATKPTVNGTGILSPRKDDSVVLPHCCENGQDVSIFILQVRILLLRVSFHPILRHATWNGV
jgi:hypothetical protein